MKQSDSLFLSFHPSHTYCHPLHRIHIMYISILSCPRVPQNTNAFPLLFYSRSLVLEDVSPFRISFRFVFLRRRSPLLVPSRVCARRQGLYLCRRRMHVSMYPLFIALAC
jgi:hypothetical protein